MNVDRRGRRPSRSADHSRARELAAARIDEPLVSEDASWLAEHLVACAECRGVAAGYDEQRVLLRVMRNSPPLAPRDLWARTAAAIEGGGGRSSRWRGRLAWPVRFPLVPVAGLLAIAVAVGAGLLNGVGLFPGQASPTGPGGVPVPTPIAMTAGEVQFVTRGEGGVLELSTRRYDQVCPVGTATCGTSSASDTTQLPVDLAGLGKFDAIISPSQDHIVVMGTDPGVGGVYVVPVPAAQTPVATIEPPSPTPTAVPTPTATPAVPSSPVTPTATPGPGLTPTPGTPATPAPTPSPSATATASVSPTEVPSTPPDASETPSVSAGPSPDVSASPGVDVTPAPAGHSRSRTA